jgi:ABC-type dipeptide/oligopeptide/nickel transport system permease component
MIDVRSQDYMRTARAKGLMPATISRVHALKNA